MMGVWKSEDNFWKLVFSFCYMYPGNPTQVIRPDGRHIYLLQGFLG